MAEKKFFDVSAGIGGVQVDYVGIIDDLSVPAQGSTNKTRVGDKITVTSIQGVCWWEAVNNLSVVRMIIFKWYDNSVPTTAQILEVVGDERAPISPLNHDQKVRRKVFLDKTYTLSQAADTWLRVFPFFVDLRKRGEKQSAVHFDPGAVTGMGIFYVLFITEETTGSGNEAIIRYYIRTNFTDL